MSRKRLRTELRLSKRDPAYWRDRLFKNTFTYKGRRTEVGSWSVKLQLFGKRRAFTLASHDPTQAAEEACQIYQTIAENGWKAVTQIRSGRRLRRRAVSEATEASEASAFDEEYWRRRLIQRKYPEPAESRTERELSVRIEHGRINQYFPLGTSDEREAARRATDIYGTIAGQGWAAANALFPRELSLAVRWQDDPLAWTYTSIHTRPNQGQVKPAAPSAGSSSELGVSFLEPDAGIRFALAEYANQQKGFRCEATFADPSEALREIPRRNVSLILANHELSDEAGLAALEEFQRLRPGLVVLAYSVFEDTDQLFKSTPGGSVVYMLKRTPPSRLFEPIADLIAPLTREQVASLVRNYFQLQCALLPSGPPFWQVAKLTPRELEILACLSTGDLLKEIADKLGISNWTVQGHVKRIFEKLKVHTRTEAVIKYLQK